MYCAKCGFQNSDANGFCEKCGNPLNRQPVIPTAAPAPIFKAPSDRPAVEVVRKTGGSVLFLIAALCYTATLLLRIIATIDTTARMSEVYNRLIRLMDLPSDVMRSLRDMPDLFAGSSLISFLSGCMPTLLICIGLWMFFAACKSRRGNTVSTGGLTLIRVIAIIRVAFSFIAIAILLLCVGLLFVILFSTGELDQEYTALILLPICLSALAAIVVLVFQIVYGMKLMKTLREVIYSATTGQPSDRVSTFFAVCSILYAVWSVLINLGFCFAAEALQSALQSALSTYSSTLELELLLAVVTVPAWAIAANLVFAVAMFLFGVIVFRHRSDMKALMLEQSMQFTTAAPAPKPFVPAYAVIPGNGAAATPPVVTPEPPVPEPEPEVLMPDPAAFTPEPEPPAPEPFTVSFDAAPETDETEVLTPDPEAFTPEPEPPAPEPFTVSFDPEPEPEVLTPEPPAAQPADPAPTACPQCGGTLSANVAFCIHCGAKTEADQRKKHFCSACGARLSADDAFCGSCGAKV